MSYKIDFDADKCIGCGQCVDICPVSVWEMQDGKSNPVNAEECLGCVPVSLQEHMFPPSGMPAGGESDVFFAAGWGWLIRRFS